MGLSPEAMPLAMLFFQSHGKSGKQLVVKNKMEKIAESGFVYCVAHHDVQQFKSAMQWV
ncbi:MAG: hypothetical protein AAFV25_05455 [Bacteroidota bacterium]